MAEKRYLMTPGPTPVPPQVLAAMALPIVHHRSPDFRPTYRQVLDRLKDVYRTQTEVLLYTASGTAGLESVAVRVPAHPVASSTVAIMPGSPAAPFLGMARMICVSD